MLTRASSSNDACSKSCTMQQFASRSACSLQRMPCALKASAAGAVACMRGKQ